MQYHTITAAGLQTLKDEVTALQQARPAKIAALAAAAALGDRSENADYTAAKRDLRQLEGRLRYLDRLIRYAEVVPPTDQAIVALGQWVTVRFDDEPASETYHLVGPHEASMAAANLASDSPLGHALMAHGVGDTVTVQAPSGAYPVTIMGIRSDMV
ncbi:transcription elongation factor GreA [Lacticaseibacillus absianus]|uniref:transcription elongation factor GreA n=1 Tax=Lacticaseibacillus absianus TaxID=2729623 RepID=UPI0015C76FF4|nr:transcription elongation factor GreA [Lacticaseibacillus absianus]